MLFKLMFILVVVPLVELALLFKVADLIGGWETFWLVVFTGIVGSILARHEGGRTWLRIQHQLQAGRLPTIDIVGAGLIFAAGLLLLTPGIITDMAGFAMLAPPLRRRLAAVVLRSLKKRFHISTGGAKSGNESYGVHRSRSDHRDDQAIEVEAEVISDEKE